MKVAVENIITDNLPIWSSTIQSKSSAGRGTSSKRNLYGVKKLRELILDLAVRGLLVPQDPNDEPASVLLEKIDAEKKRLVNDGKIKNNVQPSKITPQDAHHIIPESWSWVRLPTVSHYNVGKTPPTKNSLFWTESPNGIPWVSIADMHHYGSVETTKKHITQVASEQVFNYSSSPVGTILMSFKLTIGKISRLKMTAFHNEAIISIYPLTGMFDEFLFHLLPTLAQAGDTKAAIKGNTLNSESLAAILVPLPPLDEQHRIVAKVDELMALCDTLEQQQEDSIQAHETLVEVLLEALSSAVDSDAFHAAWGRISEHFDVLFTTEHSINKLKETILQLAVMGKLVPQDPSDEPASILLEKIAAEKEKLSEEGKLKKQKSVTNHLKKKPNYNLPNGWVFCKLLDIIQISSGDGLTSSNMNKDGHVPVYGGNGVTGYHDQANVSDETLVIGRVGFYCGSVHVTPKSAWITDNAFITWHSKNLLSRAFLVHLLRSTNLKEDESATAQPVISGKKIYPIIVGLPPLAEQHRIVVKVDELMGLCDQLKKSVQKAQETQILLTDTVVENAL